MDTFNKFLEKIDALKAEVKIPKTIKEWFEMKPDGVTEEEFLGKLDNMVEQAFDDQCTGANPRYPLMSELKEMYLNAYYGR